MESRPESEVGSADRLPPFDIQVPVIGKTSFANDTIILDLAELGKHSDSSVAGNARRLTAKVRLESNSAGRKALGETQGNGT